MGSVNQGSFDTFETGLEVQDQPFFFTTYNQANIATQSAAVRAATNNVLQKSGITELTDCVAGFEYLISKSPIQNLSQMKGVKVRTASDLDNAAIKAMGGIPVSIPLGETYEGLETGTVSAAISTVANIYSSGWFQAAKNLDMIPVKLGVVDLAINNKTLASLSSHEKSVLTAAAAAPSCATAEQSQVQVDIKAMQQKATNVLTPASSDLNAFVASTEQVRNNYSNSTALAKSMTSLMQGVIKGSD
jgi:TRAP-type C4-dicarboxylate transport system substrate-binding protein